MPRIPLSLLKQARRIDPLLVLLLRECRELRAAQNELRWLREYAQTGGGTPRGSALNTRLRNMVHQRAKGMPLQYILGDQPFGELDILCRKDVLIPRYVEPIAHVQLSAEWKPWYHNCYFTKASYTCHAVNISDEGEKRNIDYILYGVSLSFFFSVLLDLKRRLIHIVSPNGFCQVYPSGHQIENSVFSIFVRGQDVSRCCSILYWRHLFLI